jgi:heme-binding protein
MKWIKRAATFLFITIVGIQFIPVERSNPPETGQPPAPEAVTVILRRACYDCHSNETRWPWYSRLAPVSFWLWHDVKHGRQELNFSVWDRYDTRRKGRKLKEIVKEVKGGDMPPWYYVPLHPDAKLSSAERDAILRWANPS